MATLKNSSLRIFDFAADGVLVSQVVVPKLDGTYGRLRTPMLGPDGALYVTTSNGGGADRILRVVSSEAPAFPAETDTQEVAENSSASTIVATVTATDPDGEALTYSLGGTDAAFFNIADAAVGDLRANAPLDYETRISYEVVVTATDPHGLSDSITLTIAVTNVNEAPEFPSTKSIARIMHENTGTGIDIGAPVAATDPDSDTLTYSLGGTDAVSFDIVSWSGQLRTSAPLDYDTKSNYSVTVSVSDKKNADGDPDTAIDDIIDVIITVIGDPRVTITADHATAAETAPSITFTLLRTVNTDAALSVNVRITETGDVLAATRPGAATFNANSDTTSLRVNLVEDIEDEADSVVTVEVIAGTGYVLGSSASAQTTVTDDDHVPVTIAWEETALTVNEDAGAVTLRAVTVTTKDKMPEAGSSFDVSVYTADGSATQVEDYGPLSTTETFRQADFSQAIVNGQQRYRAVKEFTLHIVDDTDDEPDESFTTTLAYSNPGLPHLRGSETVATVTIIDNDHVPVVLGWEQTALTAEEASNPGGTLPVTLRAFAITTKDKMPESGSSFDVTVNTADGSATQPADYTTLSTTETFSPSDFIRRTINGQPHYRAEKLFTVLITHDDAREPNEHFTANLAYSDPGPPHLIEGDLTATVTITDDLSSTVDLQLSGSSSRPHVSRGEELTYDYTVTNDGPATSTNTIVATTLDPGLSFVSATSTAPCTHSGGATGGVVTCEFGTLSANEQKAGEVVVRVEPTAAADITVTSAVSSDELDNQPGNNTATEFTELVAPPQRVNDLRVTAQSDTHIDLSWTMPADNGSPITAYELERKTSTESYAPVSSAPGVSATTYRDSAVSVGTAYTYRLRAVNADGEAEWSNEVTATAEEPPPSPPPPRPPSGGGGGGGSGGGGRSNQRPEIEGPDTPIYQENGTGPVATYTADDPDGDDISGTSTAWTAVRSRSPMRVFSGSRSRRTTRVQPTSARTTSTMSGCAQATTALPVRPTPCASRYESPGSTSSALSAAMSKSPWTRTMPDTSRSTRSRTRRATESRGRCPARTRRDSGSTGRAACR